MNELRVSKQTYKYAMCCAPTRHWRSGMNQAMCIIENNVTREDGDYFLVDGEAWRDAMQILARLPSGGRHVWKARAELFRQLNKAVRQGEDA